jgi:hypothetical protein
MVNLWCDIPHIYCCLASTFCRAILHDPIVFPEPDSFKPERFINTDGSFRDDPVVSTIFGFGKRICPGRHLADAMMFIVIASFLSVFNIKKGNDTDEGPDTYPYTGTGVRCGHRVPMTVQETRRVDRQLFFLAFHALSPTLSSQEIERRKSLLLPVSSRDSDELLMLSVFLVYCFLAKDVLRSTF